MVDPFPDYSAPHWYALDPDVLASEGFIAKFHLLDALELTSPYRGLPEPLWHRVWRAVDCLARFPDVTEEWKQAALYIMANTVYLPQALMADAWQALYQELKQQELSSVFNDDPSANVLDSIHIFENDPSGMTGLFCHVNSIEGRLDRHRLERIQGVDQLADVILDLNNPLKQADAARTVQGVFVKKVWVLLVDKSLSGHSLEGDLKRLLMAREIAEQSGYPPPRIVILCQVMTDKAEQEVKKLAATAEPNAMAWYRSVFFDQRFSLLHPDTQILRDSKLRKSAKELCEWFASTLIAGDERYDRMRDRSHGNLTYGYRSCGLTLVDYENCPTDSLPLLWYETPPGAKLRYAGPYVRINSRIGAQEKERSAEKWDIVAQIGSVKSLLSGMEASHGA